MHLERHKVEGGERKEETDDGHRSSLLPENEKLRKVFKILRESRGKREIRGCDRRERNVRSVLNGQSALVYHKHFSQKSITKSHKAKATIE